MAASLASIWSCRSTISTTRLEQVNLFCKLTEKGDLKWFEHLLALDGQYLAMGEHSRCFMTHGPWAFQPLKFNVVIWTTNKQQTIFRSVKMFREKLLRKVSNFIWNVECDPIIDKKNSNDSRGFLKTTFGLSTSPNTIFYRRLSQYCPP